MKKLILIAFFALSALARADISVPTTYDRGYKYFEFSFPVEWIKEFNLLPQTDHPIEENKKKNLGWGSLEFGFQPFSVGENDGFAEALFKNVVFSIDVTGHAGAGSIFENFLYTSETAVTNIYSTCYTLNSGGGSRFGGGGAGRYWNGECGACYNSNNEYCTHKDVFGNDTYIRYVSGTVGVGLKLPVKFGKHVEWANGLVVRLQRVVEGQQTDNLTKSWKTGLAFGTDLKVNLTDTGKHVLAVSVEKSLTGPIKYTSGQVGYQFRWGVQRK